MICPGFPEKQISGISEILPVNHEYCFIEVVIVGVFIMLTREE